MFDSFKAMGTLAGLMKNRERLVEAGRRVRDRLERTVVHGRAGGGAVTASVNGHMTLLSVELDPAMLSARDEAARQMVQDLIREAVNDALTRAQAAAKEAIAQEAEELGLGEMAEQLQGLLP